MTKVAASKERVKVPEVRTPPAGAVTLVHITMLREHMRLLVSTVLLALSYNGSSGEPALMRRHARAFVARIRKA